jgi:hypothetical protein
MNLNLNSKNMSRRHHINPPLNVYRKIALSFIIIVAVLIGVIFYFTLSYAYVTVYPNAQEIKSDFNFIVVEDEQSVNSEEGIFGGKIIDQTIEAEKVFPATGNTILAGDTLGKVKIFNNLDRSQVLIATTRLLTSDNILFRIKNRVDIPARGSVETVAYPDDPTKPLVKAGTKFTVPGLSASLQEIVYAQAIEDFVASGQPVTVVSKDDLTKAQAAYAEELAQQAIAGIGDDKSKVLKTEILSEEYSNKEGDQVSEFKLKLKVKVSGALFDQDEVVAYSKKVLDQVLPEGKEIVSDSSDKLIFELEKVDSANKLAQLKSNIAGMVVISEKNSIFDLAKFKKMSVEELKSSLSNIEDIEKVEVKMFPSWMKKMPYFQDHIIIKVNK